jgi:hypothetical protein
MKYAPTTAQLPGESVSSWHKRDYNACMTQMEHCYLMQRDRRLSGYLGAALHYQHYAALWYERAQAALVRYRVALATIAAYEVLLDLNADAFAKACARRTLNVTYGKFGNDQSLRYYYDQRFLDGPWS